MADTQKGRRFDNLHEYLAAHAPSGTKRWMVAKELGVSGFRFTALLYPDRYSVRVDDELAAAIAKLLNQPVSHVRRMYSKAA